jgi:hypothetical protein
MSKETPLDIEQMIRKNNNFVKFSSLFLMISAALPSFAVFPRHIESILRQSHEGHEKPVLTCEYNALHQLTALSASSDPVILTEDASFNALHHLTTPSAPSDPVILTEDDALNDRIASDGTLLHIAHDTPHGEDRGQISAAGTKVIEVKLPTSSADSFMRWERLDGIGPARYGELDPINAAKPVIRLVP